MIEHRMINPLVWLGLIPKPRPAPERGRDLFAFPDPRPPLLIDGLLHQGCKMVLAGTSKSSKTWTLLEMALSVSTGQDWWGHKTAQSPVLYINFELPRWQMQDRLTALVAARPELAGWEDTTTLWNLRGHAADLTSLRPELEKSIADEEFGLIIVDPAYKLLGDRDENSNSDITSLMNEFERFSERTGAAVVIAHHFAKGDASGKYAMDRMSGAGAWARDPDAILVMTPHEEENCYTVSSVLRCLPPKADFVVEWAYPLMRVTDLDPSALKSGATKQKKWTDREFIEKCVQAAPKSLKFITDLAETHGGTRRTAQRYLKRLAQTGIIGSGGGLYWRKETPENL
jgi:hypothetical protein